MSYTVISENEWNQIPPLIKHTRKARPVLWNYITNVISDTTNRHCYLTNRHMGAKELRELSSKVSGDWWGKKNHFVHTAGPNSEIYIHEDKWPEYLSIREAAQELTEIEHVGWHPAQCSKSVDEWLAFHEQPASEQIVKLLLPDYSLHAVYPCHLPMAYEHDMSGAYWQIVKATPTPRLYIHPHLPHVVGFRHMDKERAIKWRKMVELIDSNPDLKPARLAIVGNWVGRYSGKRWRYAADWHYRNGKLILTTHRRPSGLSTFGLLIVRMVYELCQEELLQDSGVYGWVDCVMTQKDTPTYWNQLGIPSTIKGSGELYLYSAGAYQIGSRKIGGCAVTKHGMKPVPRALQPHILPRNFYYHRKLLPQWGAIPRTIEELPPVKRISLPPEQLLLPNKGVLVYRANIKQPDFTEPL